MSIRTWENPEEMIGVDEALDRILSFFQPLPTVDVPILDALGLVAALDVVAPVSIPPFRNSAMDGYAVRAIDTASAPVLLPVAGMIAAGSQATARLEAGQAIRIMTGAPIPEGADAVVRFEETDEAQAGESSRSTVVVTRPVQPHENVRDPGEDIRAGTIAIASGGVIGPAEVGVLASLNLSSVPVHRRPRVAILSTGDEVVDLGPELLPGQIRNSNTYTIAALVRMAGGEPLLLGVARDSTDDLRSKLASVSSPDLYVTSGGVSLGDYDMVKDVLRGEGRVDIWQVRMKPGKPLAFGHVGKTPLLGLPGNPVAALVSFVQFGRAAIRSMLGHPGVRPREVEATLTEPLTNPGRRRHYVRGVFSTSPDGYEVRPTGDQGAAILTAVVRGNCFIVVPETCDNVEAGMRVLIQPFDGLLRQE